MPSRRSLLIQSGVLALQAILLCACIDQGIPRIAVVQGDDDTSPLAGRVVTVDGIVSGDFQDGDANSRDDLGGFFLQDAEPDGNPATSDGIFVFEQRMRVDVATGDRLRVTGEVIEYFGETQLVAESVTVLGKGRVQPFALALPVDALATNADGMAIADLEAYEGMLVRIDAPLTVVDLRDLESHGAVLLHAGGRAFQFTNANRPDVEAYAEHRSAFARRSLILDDGQRAADRRPARYLFPNGNAADQRPIRTGDRVVGLTGVLRYSRGSGSNGTEAFRLMPVADPAFESAAPRPPAPPRGEALRVMSFNALNFFTTLAAGDNVCGPGRLSCRGANTLREFERQRARLAEAIARADADIVGLMEIENDEGATLRSLVAALEARSDESWRSVETGSIGDDAIKVGIVYRPDRASTVGRHAILDSTVDAEFDDDRNRPALAQTFEQSSGDRVTVVVNHLKSKGSDCNDLGDPDRNDGQGNCNRTRARAAAALARWLATDPTGSDSDDVLIIGDLNAYLQEDPLVALESAGFVNLLESQIGDDAYSFVFRGESGALDHALASPSLLPRVVRVVDWHINADEAEMLDYNLEGGRDPALFKADEPWRASDHDPIVVDIE